MNDRQLGEQFAAILEAQKPAGAPQAIAVLQDLLGAEVSLLAPLKDLLGRPGFLTLLRGPMATGSQRAQRDSLLQALAETYHPQVLERLEAFLDGYLQGVTAESPPTVVLDEPAAAPPSPEPHPQRLPAPPGDGKQAPRERPPTPLLLLLLGGGLAGIGGVAALQANLLCAPLALCSAASIAAAATALEEASKAAAVLDETRSLTAFERSLAELERELERIGGDAGLSNAQRGLRQRLTRRAVQARSRLRVEEDYRQTVQQASREGERIGGLAPPAAAEARTALRRRLASIPVASFSFPQAEELQRGLVPPSPTPSPSPAPSRESPAPPLPMRSAVRAWPSRPSPRPPAASPGAEEDNAPLRSEPLWP